MTYAPPPKVEGRNLKVVGTHLVVRGPEGFAQWAANQMPATIEDLAACMARWGRKEKTG